MAKNISELEIPEKWKRKFTLIEEAGGVNTLNLEALTFGERLSLFWNIWALLFGPLYYVYLGLWKPALSYFAIFLVFIFLLLSFGWIEVANASGYGLSIAYMMRSNTLYYRKVVLEQNPWF